MIAQTIELVLSNIPLIMFIAALAAAFLTKGQFSTPERYLSWLLLLSIGVEGIWGGVFHVFFPSVASGQIGWSSSPFEYEIGVSDVAMGVAAVVSFWRSLSFKSGVIVYTVLAYFGMVIGHLIQAFGHGDYSSDNFGILLVITILHVILLPWLLWLSWKARKASA